MRELKVTLKFTKECLGNGKQQTDRTQWPIYMFARTPDGCIRFEASWWRANIRFAAEVLCKHHKAVEKVHFDIAVQCDTATQIYKRYFTSKAYMRHEALFPGDTVQVKCVVPDEISDDDFKQLMGLIGRFRGISPFGPKEYGFFTVEGVHKSLGQPDASEDLQRRSATADTSDNTASGTVLDECAQVHPAQDANDEGRAGLCQR